ncbi:MAG: hypothetical protein K6T35_13940, partial [Meiothermus silvanus]|nr:hypothetical protein [Allomeiothermus silvanus]
MAWDYWTATFGERDEADVAREAAEAGKTVEAYVEESVESVAWAKDQDGEGTFDPAQAKSDILRQMTSMPEGELWARALARALDSYRGDDPWQDLILRWPGYD